MRLDGSIGQRSYIQLAVARVASGIVSIGTYTLCKNLQTSTAQSYIDTANQAKAHADKVALTKRDRCRETTNYYAATRQYRYWKGPLQSQKRQMDA